MNTIKTIVVTATLLAVGYGANVVLNRPLPDDEFGEKGLWNEPVDAGSGSPGPPELKIPMLDGNGAAPRNPFATPSPQEAAANEPQIEIPDVNEPGTGSPLPWSQTPAERPAAARDSFSSSDVAGSGGRTPPMDLAEQQAAPAATPLAPPVSLIPNTLPPHGNAQTTYTTSIRQDSFDATWAMAQEMIQNQDLSGALFTLSELYGDATLTGESRDALISNLDQLAGSVIYSPRHLLQPAFVAQGGESLQQLAAEYQVPAEFLARVNGIPVGQPLAPGQSLKIIQGPFRGELSRSSLELTLFLGRSYAGRFSVSLGRGFPTAATVLQVIEKSGPKAYLDATTGQQIAAGAPNNPYGMHWIGLTTGLAGESTVGLHSEGDSVDASDTRGCIGISRKDADDLQAILSVGSQIAIVP